MKELREFMIPIGQKQIESGTEAKYRNGQFIHFIASKLEEIAGDYKWFEPEIIWEA